MKIKDSQSINLEDIIFSNANQFVLIGGLNVIENLEDTLKTASYFQKICEKHSIPFVFKVSYDKANRSSVNSYRGPGLEKGIQIFTKLKEELGIKLLTDVHSPEEASIVSKVVDILQLPAFLARQTDLINAIAKAECVVNIKKPQFLSPPQMKNIVDKFYYYGNKKLLICERGTNFGYDNLIVDFLGFGIMKRACYNLPLIFDVTHSLQCRDSFSKQSKGRRTQILELAKAGIAVGLAGIFLEAHPEPDKALCDGPSALPLELLESFLIQLKEIDLLVKGQKQIIIE